MSTLTAFRDHCRTMAAAKHKPECPSLAPRPSEWICDDSDGYETLRWKPRPPNPTCDGGCLTDADRALFAQMASEVDDYLAPQVDLFGEVTPEPESEPPVVAEMEDAR